ncbi:hypothetical protein [Gordonia sp. (in: high G+C Gram-positive bacteria)]|uniref:hypothetical protein n=1 Tax=Gordonia sp. (in: high G+C Gram-positive bacteria) TaxID=84139 RepID=UPI001DB3DE89|nr:hypothetical protein [Gordonia sp. (in: high G+C Gram-positive bacteria)]MCB1296809.1 hypothetical protein [Gordonia sp. (in: high G+C Gram-positive bacteria)]HMS76382.1 hypothetical protein [Gordonia sp. (in: high G+C Gram-positive bacteria)]HQV16699.1 hypothetical protein [Gordonia sp. (in: high G+C Gram-positive bacteria)]
MTTDAPSRAERTILFALMAHAKPIRNPDLSQISPEMKKERRDRLNDLGLVESVLVKRTYVHTLTDAGWAWCAAELHSPTPPGSGTVEKALAAVLRGIGRYLRATDTLLSEVFGVEASPEQTEAPAAAGLSSRVRAAYDALCSHPGAWVRVAELRAALNDVAQDEFDDTLVALQREPGVRLEPNEQQSSLTDDDRAAAVRVGNQLCHLFAIEG